MGFLYKHNCLVLILWWISFKHSIGSNPGKNSLLCALKRNLYLLPAVWVVIRQSPMSTHGKYGKITPTNIEVDGESPICRGSQLFGWLQLTSSIYFSKVPFVCGLFDLGRDNK